MTNYCPAQIITYVLLGAIGVAFFVLFVVARAAVANHKNAAATQQLIMERQKEALDTQKAMLEALKEISAKLTK